MTALPGRRAALALLAAVAPAAAAADDAPFGMRLRKPPAEPAKASAPAVVAAAPENEAAVVRLKDDTLRTFYLAAPAKAEVWSVGSKDSGATWGDARKEFALPGGAAGHYGVQVLRAADGELHAAFHVFRGTKGQPGVDRNLDVWHARTDTGTWQPAAKVFEGYVGALRGFVQLKSGRLVLAFARAVPERWKPPPAGQPDRGWHNVVAFTSDDRGATWAKSPDELTVVLPGPNTTRYGAIEPHLVELKDGRVWMLIRDRGGLLYESFSADGSRWSEPAKTRFVSSDSPAAAARLADGRLVLVWSACQRWDDPRSYAMGGREVLHAAVSADDGKTWRGFREVLTDPVPGPARGDRGSAYPTAVQAADGKVVVVSGQGEGRRAVVRFDPGWLAETAAADDFAAGLEQWTLYGARGTELAADPDRPKAKALSVTAPDAAPTAAVWNFPAGAAGTLTVRVRPRAGWKGGVLALTDHFGVSADAKAEDHAVFAVPLPAALEAGTWHDVTVSWKADGPAAVTVGGKAVGPAARKRAAPNGVNYLRVRSAAGPDPAGFLVGAVKVDVSPPGATEPARPWDPVKRPGAGPGGCVLDLGPEKAFDAAWVGCPSVLADGDGLRMWYSSHFDAKHGPGGIGLAAGRDGLAWERANGGKPVLGVGPDGAFDDGQVMGPCVLRGRDGTYRMWYTAMPAGARHASGIGFYRVGLATSRDGLAWERANGGKPVLDLGGAGAPDEVQAATPCVLADGDGYRMWYAAWSPRHGHTVCTARSRDGVAWEKDAGGPVEGLEADAFGPEVVRAGDGYLMVYMAMRAGRGLYAATSRDGRRWAPVGRGPLLEPGGRDAFDADRLGHAALLLDGGRVRVWYTGYRRDAAGLRLRVGAADLLPKKEPAP
jgi:hypothetical protein